MEKSPAPIVKIKIPKGVRSLIYSFLPFNTLIKIISKLSN